MKKSRFKVFFENVFIYGIFGVVDKIIPLIMLPIVTRLLADTTEYGAYNMFTTIQNFGIQIAILGLYDAVFREYFEKDDPKFRRSVLSTALDIVGIVSVVICLILVVFKYQFTAFLLKDQQFQFVVIASGLGVIAGATRSIFSLPTRIKNERKVYIIANMAQPIITYGLILLFVLKYRLTYSSLIYASVIVSYGLTAYFIFHNGKEFSLKAYDKNEAKELLKIGLPLVPTFIIYWVFNSFDKVMITNMRSLAELGIFGIGSKVASVSQLVYTAFATGWQYFAFSTMKDKDQVEMTSKIMEYLSVFSVVMFFIATTLDEIVFRFVFDGDYELGFTVFPYLLLAPLLLMIYQTGANQFLVCKKSYLSTLSLSVGAVANIIMNYFFIKSNGIAGAALATLFGYIISVAMMCIITTKMKMIKLTWRPTVLLLMVIALSFKIYFHDDVISHVIAIGMTVATIIMYRKDIALAIHTIKTALKNRKENSEQNA
jgi:O-antigen/teichoic acid export membrane protein